MASLQIRSNPRHTLQQHANRAAGSLIARQFVTLTTGTITWADHFPLKDTALCNTAGGNITINIPTGSDEIIGLPMYFYKTSASNSLTVQRTSGSGNTIEGATSLSLTAENGVIGLVWDGSMYRSIGTDLVGGAAATVVAQRTALGINKEYIPLRVTTLVGSNVYRVISKYAGTITRIDSIIEGILTTGDATLQAKLNGSNIGSTTTGLITITQAGSAAGDKDSATPATTNITVAVGDELSLTVGGTNATATAANCFFEVTRT